MILCVVGSIGSVIAYSLSYSMIKGFLLTLVVQLVLYNMFKYTRDGWMTVKIKQLELEEIKSFEKQGMELECAHCRHVTYVPIRFDQQNILDCPECNKNNAIYLNVTVARETVPLNTEAITTRLLIDEEERIKQTIRESNDDE